MLFIAIAFAVLILFFSCSIPLKNAVYFGFYAFLIGEFITSLFWQVHLYLCARYPFQPVMPYVGYFGTCLVCLGILYWYERRYAGQNAQLQLRREMLISTALTAVGVFLFSNVSNVFRDTPFSGQTSLQINLIRLLVDAAGFFLLETNRMVRDEEAKRAELTLLRSLIEQQYENYQASERSMAFVHQKYHDLKHQIVLRDSCSGDDLLQHVFIDQEVLPIFLLKCHFIFLQDRDGVFRSSKFCHISSLLAAKPTCTTAETHRTGGHVGFQNPDALLSHSFCAAAHVRVPASLLQLCCLILQIFLQLLCSLFDLLFDFLFRLFVFFSVFFVF